MTPTSLGYRFVKACRSQRSGCGTCRGCHIPDILRITVRRYAGLAAQQPEFAVQLCQTCAAARKPTRIIRCPSPTVTVLGKPHIVLLETTHDPQFAVIHHRRRCESPPPLCTSSDLNPRSAIG